MPITLVGTRITVEYQAGDPKGGTSGTSYNMADILAASDAGEWNPAVQRIGRMYYVPYSIYIQGASTWFGESIGTQDYETVIYFDCPTQVDAYVMYSNTGSHIRFGNNNKASLPSVIIMLNSTQPIEKTYFALVGDVILRNTSIHRMRYMTIAGNESYIAYIINCQFQQVYWGFNYNNRTHIDILKIYGQYYQFKLESETYYNNNIILVNGTQALVGGSLVNLNATFRNLKIIDSSINDALIRVGRGGVLKTINLLDCTVDFNKINFVWTSTGYINARAYVNLQTSLSLHILNDNNEPVDCNVSVYADDDTLLYSGELEGGVLDSYPLTYAYKYRRINSGDVEIEDVNYEPLRIVISKVGYQDLEINGVSITPGVPTIIRGTLLEPVYYNRTLEGTITQHQLTGAIETHEISGTIKQHTLEGVIETHELAGDISQAEIKGEIS